MLTDSEKLEIKRARDFAIKAHGEQRYGKHPYVYHLDAVAMNAIVYYKPMNMLSSFVEFIQAAYLHDVVEDTQVTIEEIELKFGSHVRYLVANLTHNDLEDYENYLDNINSKSGPRLLKIADVMANLHESYITGNNHFIERYSLALRYLID